MFANNTNVEFKYGVGGNNKLNSSSSLTSDFYNTFSKIITLEKGNSEITDISSPWGFHNLIVNNESYKVKILSVNPFSQLSLQKHHYREEHWVVVKGSGEVDINGKQIKLKVGENPNLGLDEFGDITIGNKELPIIRGGFTDRNGVEYADGINGTNLSALNIVIRESIPRK